MEVDAIFTDVENLKRPYVAQVKLQGISNSLACISIILENNKKFLQKWLRCRDGIKSTETCCHTAKQYLAVGHTCKGVAPYPYVWQHERSLWQKEVQSHYNIVLLA